MKFYHSKIPVQYLIIAAILVTSATVILDKGQKFIPTPYYELQVAAAQQMQRCIDSLKFASIMPVAKKLDPNQTNLIGVEYSPITTTLGNLKAKRSSTNPDFAALIVRWFHEIDLKKGDIIAIGGSGSFPALILATICAAEVMKLKPVIILSLGASSYGANRPNFTYLDIENFLFQKNRRF